MITLLNEEFTEEQQKWYIAILFMYLNYHPTNDYPINLETAVKILGFAHKRNAKRTLENNFTVDEDYKINVLPTEHGQFASEEILLNMDTFKNLCMLVKTPEGKAVRKYYVTLENINNKIVKMEIEEKEEQHRIELKEKEQQLEDKSKLIETLENKPDTEGFHRSNGFIYLIKDTSKPGHYKIGFANDPHKRNLQLNTASSTHSLKIVCRFETYDKEFAEKTIHCALQPFRIKFRKEWFYFKNDFEVAYTIKTIKECINYIEKYNIKEYNQLKQEQPQEHQEVKQQEQPQEHQEVKQQEHQKEQPQEHQEVKQQEHQKEQPQEHQEVKQKEHQKEHKKEHKKEQPQEHQEVKQQEHQKEQPQEHQEVKQKEHKKKHQEVKQQENQENLDILKNLEEINKEEDLQKQMKKNNSDICKRNGQQMSNKSGDYKGTSWNSEKNKWSSIIKVNYNSNFLDYYNTELEAAKVYNDYASYLNNTENTEYLLNDIWDYTPIARDVLLEIKNNKLNSITSKYDGVSYDSTRKYYVVSIKYNNKTYALGNNSDEIECAKLYNQQALYFNSQFDTKFVVNEIENYVTIEKNIYKEIQDNKKLNKSSKYYGVTLNKKTNKYRALLVNNKKQIHLGFFEQEIDAAKSYNEKAKELNEQSNRLIYKINKIEPLDF